MDDKNITVEDIMEKLKRYKKKGDIYHDEEFNIHTHSHAEKVIEVHKNDYRRKKNNSLSGFSNADFHRKFLQQFQIHN